MNELEILKAKQLRGAIIEKLYIFYGEAATLASVKKLVRYGGYNTDKEFKKALKYLADAGYVKIEAQGGEYWDSLSELTPEGVRLAEGGGEDAGVSMDEQSN